jgi:hypothetical protein
MQAMVQSKTVTKGTRQPTAAAAKGRQPQRFTEEERAAMRERARELKASASQAEGESEALAKIAEMTGPDRLLAERLHALIKGAVPGISAKTWYGMPAYAKDGNTICFFKPAQKFKTRYATLGFSDKARLDDGNVWATEYAVQKLSPADEKMIRALVVRAAS